MTELEKEKCELLGIIQGKDEVITKLKAQIEEMKCCENCRHHRFYGDTLTCKCGDCNNYEKWEAHSHCGYDFHLTMEDEIQDEKPNRVENCKYIRTCDSAQLQGCVGCNVWNYLYDIEALKKWCKQQDTNFMLFTMEMQRMLNKEN